MFEFVYRFFPDWGFSGCSGGCSQVQADFKSFESAIQMYQLNARALPPSDIGFEALVFRPASLPADRRWVQVMTKVQGDPWGHPYQYVVCDKFPGGFGIYSTGPDGVSASVGNDPDDLNSWNPGKPDVSSAPEPGFAGFAGMAMLVLLSGFGGGYWVGWSNRRSAA